MDGSKPTVTNVPGESQWVTKDTNMERDLERGGQADNGGRK